MTSKTDITQVPTAHAPVGAPRHSGGWWLALAALIAGLAIGCIGARYWFKDQATRRYDTLKHQMEGDLVIARAELIKAQAHVDALSGNLMVEQSTRKGLETSLEAAQAELGHTRDQLAFFDQLFPPGPQGAVSIRGLDAQLLGGNLQYRALFMRNAVNAATFKGRMQFVAQGIREGKPVRITLEPARGMQASQGEAREAPAAASASPAAAGNTPAGAAASAAPDTAPGDTAHSGPAASAHGDAAHSDAAPVADDGFTLQFDEFQRSAGLLSLPPGFVPEKLTLNVLEGDAVRATRSVSIDTSELLP